MSEQASQERRPPPDPNRPNIPGDETERSEHTRRLPASSMPPVQQPQPAASAARRRQQPRRDVQRAAASPPPTQPGAYPLPADPYYVSRRVPQRPAVLPRDSGLYFPWWSLVLMVALVGTAALGVVLIFDRLSEPQTPGNQPPRIQMITSQPTLSQDFAAAPAQGQPGLWPTPIPQAQPSPTVPLPTPVPSPSLPPGEFAIGARVQVIGVGTNGLNVRGSPGYDGLPRFLAYDEDIFVLVDGPQTADGLEWWRIEDANDSSRFGWAARNYLMVASQ